MKKRNIILALALFLVMTFYSVNFVFADEYSDVPSKYINFSDVLTGKDKLENLTEKCLSLILQLIVQLFAL